VTVLLQLLISGVLLGGIYALAAFGLALIFGVSNILNLAHGEFLMLGPRVLSARRHAGDWSIPVDPRAHAAIFLVGALFERGLIRSVVTKTGHEQLTASVLVTLGLSLFIEDLARLLWGAEEKGIYYALPPIILGNGDLIISSVRLLALGCIVVITLVVHQFLRRTYLGKAVRAVTQNRRGALLVGVNMAHVGILTCGIGTMLAAIAGVFYMLLYSINPFIGLPLTQRYLCIIVLGGLGSLFGALLGGVILGLTEVFTGYLLNPHWQETVAFLMLVVFLLVRPQGLFGRIQTWVWDRMTAPTPISARPHVWLLLLGILLGLALLPEMTSGYTVRIVINACRNLVLALSFDILGGYTGYINLGHAAFFGIGAYAFGICVNGGVPVLLAAAAAVGCTALFAGLISHPFFRLRGPYYALATFGLLKLCEELTLTLSGLTGGSGGLSVLWPEHLRLTYYLNLALVVCTFGIVWLIARSQFGLGLVSIREDEQVARAFGVSIFWYKCRALVISAALAAALGPIYLSDRLYINPGEMFGLETALMPITMAILGGSGLLIGPVVGVMFLSLVQELLWTQVGVLRLASLGLVLAMVGLFMPGGLVRLAPVYSRLHRWGLVGGV
jgi:branched-subunit amino acid ABC-type transport system permease component